MTVRERQQRYLQAAHRNVYQTVDEEILPFPELYQQREDQVEQYSSSPRHSRPTEVEMGEEEEEEEEEDDDDGDSYGDSPTRYPDESTRNFFAADSPINELVDSDNATEEEFEDVHDNN